MILWSPTFVPIGNVLLLAFVVFIWSLDAELVRSVASNGVNVAFDLFLGNLWKFHTLDWTFTVNWNGVTYFALGEGLELFVTSTGNWLIAIRAVKSNTFGWQLFMLRFYSSILWGTESLIRIVIAAHGLLLVATPPWPMRLHRTPGTVASWHLMLLFLDHLQLCVQLLNIMV